MSDYDTAATSAPTGVFIDITLNSGSNDSITVTSSGSANFSHNATAVGIERYFFSDFGNGMTLSLAQMNAATHFIAGGGNDDVAVSVGAGQSINLSAKTFVDWDDSGNDRVIIKVAAGANSITGSDTDDRIRIQPGGSANVINGGSGHDALILMAEGAVDLTSTTMTNVEMIDFHDNGNTVTVNNADVASLDRIAGGPGTDILRLGGSGTTLDLTNLTTISGGVTLKLSGGDETLHLRHDVTSATEIDSIQGGAGTDRLKLASSGAMDLTGTAVTSIETIAFNAGGNTITVNNADMVAVATLTGGTNTDVIQLANGETGLNLSGLTTVTGGVSIQLGDGGDVLTLRHDITSASEINTITGGSGYDVLTVASAGAMDLTGTAMTGIEEISSNNTITVNNADVADLEWLSGYTTLALASGDIFLDLSNLAGVTGGASVLLNANNNIVMLQAGAILSGGAPPFSGSAIDSIAGGSGTDRLMLVTDGTANLTYTAMTSIEEIDFNAAGNTLIVNNADLADVTSLAGGSGTDIIQLADGDTVLDLGDLTEVSGGVAVQLGSGGDALTLSAWAIAPSLIETIAGGSGFDTLTITGSIPVDLSGVEMTGIESLYHDSLVIVNNADVASLEALGGGAMLELAASDSTLDLSNLTSVTGGGTVRLNADDNTVMLQAGVVGALDTIDGRFGTDTLMLTTTGTADFRSTTMTDIEEIVFNDGGNTIIADYADVFGVTAVTGGTGTDTLAVVMNATGSLSLAGMTFTNWTDGTDRVGIVGTAGADGITGSAVADVIFGGGGADELAGNSGRDTFLYNSASEGGDTIMDFYRNTDGDTLAFSNAGFGGELNQGTYVGTAAGVGADASTGVIVLTGAGYADAAAAEGAIQAINTQTDFIFGFFNTTSGRTEFYADSDSAAAGASTQLATLWNSTAQFQHDQITAANLAVV